MINYKTNAGIQRSTNLNARDVSSIQDFNIPDGYSFGRPMEL